MKQFNPQSHVALPNVYNNPRTPAEHIAHQFVNRMKTDPNGNDLHQMYEVDREHNVMAQSETSEL